MVKHSVDIGNGQAVAASGGDPAPPSGGAPLADPHILIRRVTGDMGSFWDINKLQVATSIDWLSYTVPFPDKFYLLSQPDRVRCYSMLAKAALPHGWRLDVVSPKSAPPGYRQCFGLLAPDGSARGRLAWNADRPQQKIFVQFTGEDLAGFPDWRGLLQWGVRHEVNYTRVDLALDIFGVAGAVGDVYAALLDGEPDTSVRKFQYVVGYQSGPNGLENAGDTLYIGSPASPRRLRIYDKQAEQGTDTAWVRFELVNRGAYANALVYDLVCEMVAGCVYGAIKNAVVGAITAFFDTSLTWFRAALAKLGSIVYEAPVIPRKETDSQRWVRRIVLPYLKRLSHAGDEFTYQVIKTVLDVWPSGVVPPDYLPVLTG